MTDFGAVWETLRETYETKIPPLAYIKPIPTADAAAEAFGMIVRKLEQ